MLEAIFSLSLTTALLLGSPGPATLALAATGATFGIKNGVPFLLGILLGLLCVMVLVGSGLSLVPTDDHTVKVVMQSLCAAYFAYIAYKIATAPFIQPGGPVIQAPKFRDGLLLNLLNPKAYAAFVALFSQMLLPAGDPIWAWVLSAGVCFAVAVSVDVIWLVLGGFLQPLFNTPFKARVFRICLATLLLASVIWAFYL